MFATTVNYTDFDGHERKETLYFNITEQQMRDLYQDDPDFSEKALTNAMETRDNNEFLRIMKKLILASYGEKSEDGKVHKKNKEIRENFECSAAFEQLMDDIMYKADEKYLKGFFTQIFPSKFSGQIKEQFDAAEKMIEDENAQASKVVAIEDHTNE